MAKSFTFSRNKLYWHKVYLWFVSSNIKYLAAMLLISKGLLIPPKGDTTCPWWLCTSSAHFSFLLLSEMDWAELFSIIRSDSRGWNTSQRNKRSGFDWQWFSIAPDTSTDDVFLLIPPLVVSAPSSLVCHDSDFAGLQLHEVSFTLLIKKKKIGWYAIKHTVLKVMSCFSLYMATRVSEYVRKSSLWLFDHSDACQTDTPQVIFKTSRYTQESRQESLNSTQLSLETH